MTVFPAPGGATSTPASWSARALKACCCSGSSSAANSKVCVGGEQRWGQSCGFDRDSGTESGVHHGWRLHRDLRGGGGAEPVHLRADGDLAEPLREPVDLLRGEP